MELHGPNLKTSLDTFGETDSERLVCFTWTAKSSLLKETNISSLPAGLSLDDRVVLNGSIHVTSLDIFVDIDTEG